MANQTRLDCVIGSTGLMRQALVQALHHARHRSAFGKHLAEQPLMRNVLSDLALESEAATLLMLRLAAASMPAVTIATGLASHRHAGRQILDLQAGARIQR